MPSSRRPPPPDDALLSLFASELESHARALSDWSRAGASLEDGAAPAAIQRAVHSLKGAARVIDAEPVAALTDTIERALQRWNALPEALIPGAADVIESAGAFLLRMARSRVRPEDFARECEGELGALSAALETLAIADSLGPDDG